MINHVITARKFTRTFTCACAASPAHPNHQSNIGIWCSFITLPAWARKFQRTLTCPTHPALLQQHEHRGFHQGSHINIVCKVKRPGSPARCSPTSPALPPFDMAQTHQHGNVQLQLSALQIGIGKTVDKQWKDCGKTQICWIKLDNSSSAG